MEEFILTNEEKQLILTRRELFKDRQERRKLAPKSSTDQPQQQNTPKQANGWDAHAEPDRVHKGRLTGNHPLGWFEDEIFKKIANMDHQKEHKKIGDILNMPVQNHLRDRIYHALCHLDVLWYEGRLPLKYKHRYERYKKEHNIGKDNTHPAHKKEGVTYKVPKVSRPFSFEEFDKFDEDEKFNPHKIYDYAKTA